MRTITASAVGKGEMRGNVGKISVKREKLSERKENGEGRNKSRVNRGEMGS